MYDIFPFPNITATSIDELVFQTNNYLIQFKEILEFALANISIDNLSQDLIKKLNGLGADIEKSVEDRDDQFNQIVKKTLSISDVINSQAFKTALDTATPDEYLVSVEQIQSSEEPGGVNIIAIKDESGDTTHLTIKNGNNGTNGLDGITPTFMIENGELKVSYDNGNTWTSLGYIYGDDGVMGIDGDDGEDGIGITKTEINSNGELIITFSNNTVSNLGVVVGAKGEKGDKGEQGIQGVKGDTGTAGQDGKDGADGVGIKTIVIDSGNLMITLTSGTTLNLGNIKGQDGRNGVDGKTPSVNFTVNLSTGNLEYTTS